MKNLLAATLVLLLLSACANPPAPSTAEPVPETPPAPSPLPTSEQQHWWQAADAAQLPEVSGTPVLINGVPCYLLTCLEDTRVYCGLDAETGGYLLARDGALLYLAAPMEALPETQPNLHSGDFDGDGAQELALLCYETPQAARLYLCEWDGGWTAVPFSPDYYNAFLLDTLTYDYRPHTATVSCYGETASYTLGAGEDGEAELHRDFSGLLFFRVESNTLTAVFGVGVDVEGQTRYFANLTASVVYDGTEFSLENLRLVPTGGV